MRSFIKKFPLNTVSIFFTIVVSFAYNVLLDRDVECTCEGDCVNCNLYMGLPFFIFFFLKVWPDKKFFSTFNYLCGCECTDWESCCDSCCCSKHCRQFWGIVAIRIFKAGLVGLLWVVSVLIDGDWYVCCKNDGSEQQKHLACKKTNITPQEQVKISLLKNKSRTIGFGLMLGILIGTTLMSLIGQMKCVKKRTLYRKLIAEEGRKMLKETLRLKAKYELRDEIRRKIRDGKLEDGFDVFKDLIDSPPTNKCPELKLSDAADTEEQSQENTEQQEQNTSSGSGRRETGQRETGQKETGKSECGKKETGQREKKGLDTSEDSKLLIPSTADIRQPEEIEMREPLV